MKIESLAAYSTASSLLLGLSNAANAQMTYFNIDPDVFVAGDMDYPIDLNQDGVSEMMMHASMWWASSAFGIFTVQKIYLTNYAEIATDSGLLQMFEGDVVSPDLDFNVNNQSFVYCYRHDGLIHFYEGTSWVNNNSYIGMRFEIDGNSHYGWVRLGLYQTDAYQLPKLIVKELAFNLTPDSPAPINVHIGTAQFPVLSDAGETGTPNDLQLHFQKADDESNISAYRVILFNYFLAPSLEEANALTSERYTELTPTGADITINFTEETRDLYGNPLLPGMYYEAIILSVADGIIVSENDLSYASNNMAFIYREAQVAMDISMGSDAEISDISGIYGSFYMPSTNLATLRAYISDSWMEIGELLALGSEYYIEFLPDSGSNYVMFTPDKLIYSSLTPNLYEKYYLNIVSIPDSITNSIPTYDNTFGYFKYYNYEVAPTVTIVDSTGTGADIQLYFPMLQTEENLKYYRIFIAKSDEIITIDDIPAIPSIKRIDVAPSGSDLDINLAEINYDTDGNNIQFNQPYKVYVALVGDFDFAPDFYSLAAPAEFILEEPLVEQIQESNLIAAPKIWADNNLIYIDGASEENHTIIILNDIGQEIIRKNFSGTNYELLIPDLPEGIYIIEIESGVVNYRQQIYLF